jgi:hypothetical protein
MNYAPLMQFFKRALGREPKLHPINQGMAKYWIKKRLVAVFPELRNNPVELEKAYRALSLEPRLGSEEGDAAVYFEMTLPTPEE